jgi:hypothetical protein
MGNAADGTTALALGLAGPAACVGLSFAAWVLFRGRHVAIDITATLGVGISTLLGVVALVFAFSFHW